MASPSESVQSRRLFEHGCTVSIRRVDGGTIVLAPGSTDEHIRAIARAQRGRASWHQLRAAGISSDAITRRVRRGMLVRVHPGVYAVTPLLPIEFADDTGAILACGPRSVVGFHSSNVMWAIRRGTARPVHVVIPHDRRAPKLGGVRVHRTTNLTHSDITVHKGLPITTPARTQLDVAATLPPKDLKRVVAEGFALGLLSFDSLYAALARAPKHPGASTLKEVLAKGELHRTTTDLERQFLDLIEKARLPTPLTQYPLLEYTADFYWPEYKLIVETDGGCWHKTPWRRKQDQLRDARVKHALNIDTIRVSDDSIEHEQHAVVAMLATAISERAS
jgi:very-short-patch-repair endonuclease